LTLSLYWFNIWYCSIPSRDVKFFSYTIHQRVTVMAG